MNKNLSENNRNNKGRRLMKDVKNFKKNNVLKFVNALKQKNNDALIKNREEKSLKKKINQETKRKLKDEKKERTLIDRQKKLILMNEIEAKRAEKKKRLIAFIGFLKENNRKKRQTAIEQAKQKKLQVLAKREQKRQVLLAAQKAREEQQKTRGIEQKKREEENARNREQQAAERIRKKQEEQNKQKEEKAALLLALKAKKEEKEKERAIQKEKLQAAREKKESLLKEKSRNAEEKKKRLIAFIGFLKENNRKKRQTAIEQAKQKKLQVLAKKEQLKKTKENKILEKQIQGKTLQLINLAEILQQNISQQVAAVSNKISPSVKKAAGEPIPKIKTKVKKPAETAQKPVFALFPLFARKKSAEAVMPAAAVIPTAVGFKKYVEPFMLVPFIRKNLFKIFAAVLFSGILGEIGFYSATFKSPADVFKKKYGTGVPAKPLTPIKPKVKKEKIPVKIAGSISIEGKRNPFSPEVLTMQVLKRPQFTGIALAYQPEVISVEQSPSIISTSSVSSSPAYQPAEVSSILKPERPSLPSFISPEEISRPQVSTLMVPPEIKNPFVYRGSMIINGIEYFFLETDDRTYRGAIGDTVKGFRIIRKQDNKIYLSKGGRIIELSTQ